MADSLPTAYPLRDLFDAATHAYSVRLTCAACGHRRVFDPHGLWYLFDRRGWTDWLKDVRARCVCSQCGARQPRLELVREPETGEKLPMPSEHRWKQELRRRR